MKLNVLIPVKKLNQIKSRLSKYLNEEFRIRLSFLMIEDILESCSSSKMIEKIYLVSYDEINEFRKYNNVEVLINKEELNKALDFALEISKKQKYEATLIIPSDIPLIEPIDIENLSKLIENNDIVLSPSCDSGTNVLIIKNNVKIKLEFGEGKSSFLLHLKNALKNNLKVAIYCNERVCLDLDDIIRLTYFQNLNVNKKSIKFLRENVKNIELE
jgi:2-phospho-L-lactate guanylyltransferase CofC